MTNATSRQLLTSTTKTADLALDFIEHEIGANRFKANWAAMKTATNPADKVAKWLAKIGAEGDADEIVKIIDELAAQGTKWLTPFTSPIPPEK